MTVITPDQRRAAAEAGDAPIELAEPQTGDSFVLVRADLASEFPGSERVFQIG